MVYLTKQDSFMKNITQLINFDLIMLLKICIRRQMIGVGLTLVYFLFGSFGAIGSENATEFEGWTWSEGFSIPLSHASAASLSVTIGASHSAMQKVIFDDHSMLGKLGIRREAETLEGRKNVILLRLGLVVEKESDSEAIHEYKDTRCFRKLLCFSGSEGGEQADVTGLKKFSSYHQIEPYGYSFKPNDIYLS